MGEKFFSTKAALSSGRINEVILEVSEHDSDYAYGAGSFRQQYRIDRDAFRTREAAVIAASTARDKKIASLEKQIDKLRALVF